jgi:hypothetical protein
MSFSRKIFWSFAVVCFLSAILVAVGDIGPKGALPYFRIKAVLAAILCGSGAMGQADKC